MTFFLHSQLNSHIVAGPEAFILFSLARRASAVPNMFRPSLVRAPGTPPVPWPPLKPTERSEILCEEGPMRYLYVCKIFIKIGSVIDE